MSSQVSTMPPGILSKSVASASSPGVEAWSAVAWLGIALALIGWSDVIIGMYPYRLGNPDWEFGAVSSALNSMPLGSVGIGVAIAAAVAQGRRRSLVALSIVSAFTLAFLLVSGVMYALSVPVVLKTLPDAVSDQFKLAILKASLLWTIYTALYVVLGRLAWNASRAKKRIRV